MTDDFFGNLHLVVCEICQFFVGVAVRFVRDVVPTGRIKPVGHGPGESLFQKCSCVFRTYYLEHHLLKLSALQLNTKVLLKSKQMHTEQVKTHEDTKNDTVGGRELDSVIQPSI